MRYNNPILAEGLSQYFQKARNSRVYLTYAILVGSILFLWWPKNRYTYFLEFQIVPSTFTLVVITVFILITYLSVRFGTEGLGHDEFYTWYEWVNLTPVPVRKLVFGKLVLSLMHTLFLVLLILPFLVIATSPSGISRTDLAASLLVLFTCAFAYRMTAVFLTSVLDEHPFLLKLLLWLIVFAIALLAMALWPLISPIHALLSRTSADPAMYPAIEWSGLAMPYYMGSVIAHAVLAFVATILLLARLLTLTIEKNSEKRYAR